jgi:AcrR family transcriptional regulator
MRPKRNGRSTPLSGTKSDRIRGQSTPTELRKTFVLEAATYAFAERGPEATTIDEIARTARVNKRYIYEMYKSKEALFEAVVEREVRRVTAFLQSAFTEAMRYAPRESVKRRYEAVYEYASRYPERVLLIRTAMRTSSPKVAQIIDEGRNALIRHHLDLCRLYGAEAVVQAESTAQMLSTMLVGMTEAVLTKVVLEGKFEAEQAIEMLTEFTLGGLEQIATGKTTGKLDPPQDPERGPSPV